jgi:histidinol dehydrogenase
MILMVKNPAQKDWVDLAKRPTINDEELTQSVGAILNSVKERGDDALFDFSKKFDDTTLEEIAVSKDDLINAKNNVPHDLQLAIAMAKSNIEKFHTAQVTEVEKIETSPGVFCWRKNVAIEKVGLYIPGGSAPLFSSILMLAIPAILAGCDKIVLCTPANKSGEIHPAILFTADILGIDTIYKIGGAQAIAALAYGTESVLKVNKIFGPGNQYVTKAKSLVQESGVAIDMPAGPSEVLVIADKFSKPEFVAADLLSQAEHGPDSQVILLSDDEEVLIECIAAVERQINDLPRRDIAIQALEHSRAILLSSIEECIEFSNIYAPEHLILAIDESEKMADKVVNAGSVFLGNYSCESVGDYASGTNHTLPTNGYATAYSGVSLDSFVKKITFQKLTEQGIQSIGPATETMAAAEGLEAHKNAVTVRLNDLKDV